MTYCLGIINQFGIVMAADSRTNAGVDHISTYKKLFDLSLPGERAIIICTSGNLSVSQGVLTRLNRDIRDQEEQNLHTLDNMYDIAQYIGNKSREIQELDRSWLEKDSIDCACNFLLGGQIKGEAPQLYLIYPQGNFIKATQETLFLQIGEIKYGKPILDRTITSTTPLEDLAKCALLSLDSTMKSNISVGPPINIVMYETDSFEIRNKMELRLGAPYIAKIRKLWEKSVRQAFEAMPDIEWEPETNELEEDILID
ncbi:MAG: proteasome-type protease [Cyanobacteria bacterium P01_F01_bin.143]